VFVSLFKFSQPQQQQQQQKYINKSSIYPKTVISAQKGSSCSSGLGDQTKEEYVLVYYYLKWRKKRSSIRWEKVKKRRVNLMIERMRK
jgi:hypothetical protein